MGCAYTGSGGGAIATDTYTLAAQAIETPKSPSENNAIRARCSHRLEVKPEVSVLMRISMEVIGAVRIHRR
jgi:hypothetical protein